MIISGATQANYKELSVGKQRSFKNPQESIEVGGVTYTMSEWVEALKNSDKKLKDVVDSLEGTEKYSEKSFATGEDLVRGSSLANGRPDYKAPYAYLAVDGVITYNGVNFVCDELRQSTSLGDMSDPSKVIKVPMSGGGCLYVNRDNLGDLSSAMGMFSPEDVRRILEAIATDKKCQEMEEELEEEKSSIGKSAEQSMDEQNIEVSMEQLDLLFQDWNEKKE